MTRVVLRNAADRALTVVNCGARGFVPDLLLDSFPRGKVVGLEPDEAECARLNARAPAGLSFVPIAAGRTVEVRTLNVTRDPDCSSLYVPNAAFFRKFYNCAETLDVVARPQVKVVDLDSYLPSIGVQTVDVLLIDVQGAELEVLEGARQVLCDVVSITTEVEFSRIYEDQPLFAQIDDFLRDRGFILFDLSRSRYRREGTAAHVAVRGQLLAGNALYLLDHERVSADDPGKLMKLALVASSYGFTDYAVEVAKRLTHEGARADPKEKAELERFIGAASGRENLLGRAIARLLHTPPGRLYGRIIRGSARANARWFEQRNFNWDD